MVLGNLPVPGRPLIWITVGQGSTALQVGAGEGCLYNFTLDYPFSPSPLETYFSLYRAVPERGRKKSEMIDERKNVQTTPNRTYCSCK